MKDMRRYLMLNLKEQFVRVDVQDILFIESLNRTVFVHTKNEVYQLPYVTLKCIGSKLPPSCFVQTHRGFVINLDWLSFIDKRDNVWVVHFQEYEQTALVSRRYRNALVENLILV